jgi:alditol oxidase
MLRNWAGNIEFSAARYHEPTTVEALQELVAASERVRAVGTGHSFNRIADTPGDLVSLRRLPLSVEVDSDAGGVRVGGGVRYADVFATLDAAGLALGNTGSLPHIAVAGACATGTHGSGRTNPILGRGVRGLTMVQGDGELVEVTRESAGEAFDGYVLALGRLGLVTELTLDVGSMFSVAQSVLLAVSDDTVVERLAEILGSAYSVSVFTALVPDANRIWLKRRLGDGVEHASDDELFGGVVAQIPQHPIDGIDPSSATEQLGVPGPWSARLPHFRLEFQPSAGEELQSEWLLPLEAAGSAWAALLAVRDQLRGPLLTVEIRCVAGDSMWLSPTAGRECVAFHFTWERDMPRVAPVVEAVERRLEPFDARPHWGKVFALSGEALRVKYPRLGDFQELIARHDPTGRFGNDLVDGWLGLE